MGRGGRWERGLKGRGHMYFYGWFMLMYVEIKEYCKAISLQLKILLKNRFSTIFIMYSMINGLSSLCPYFINSGSLSLRNCLFPSDFEISCPRVYR